MLTKRGDAVRTFSRHLDYTPPSSLIEHLGGDIGDFQNVLQAVRGVDAVIHTAAKVGIFGRWQDFHRTNVQGTLNVIRACQQSLVRKLVFTSSPSVVFTGQDQEGVDEHIGYPDRYSSLYAATKAEAERLVTAANSPEMATVSLRPHLIWGPGDPHLGARIILQQQKNRLFLVGNGRKLIDTVHVTNAAHAHVLALDKLHVGSAIAGRKFFVTNQDPWPLVEVINGILAAANLPPVRRSIPPFIAYGAGFILEQAYRLPFLGVNSTPPITRFVVEQLSTAHWFDPSQAQNLLHYTPLVSMQEGMRLLGN